MSANTGHGREDTFSCVSMACQAAGCSLVVVQSRNQEPSKLEEGRKQGPSAPTGVRAWSALNGLPTDRYGGSWLLSCVLFVVCHWAYAWLPPRFLIPSMIQCVTRARDVARKKMNF